MFDFHWPKVAKCGSGDFRFTSIYWSLQYILGVFFSIKVEKTYVFVLQHPHSAAFDVFVGARTAFAVDVEDDHGHAVPVAYEHEAQRWHRHRRLHHQGVPRQGKGAPPNRANDFYYPDERRRAVGTLGRRAAPCGLLVMNATAVLALIDKVEGSMCRLLVACAAVP